MCRFERTGQKKAAVRTPDHTGSVTAAYILFFWIEFEQNIWLHIQNGSNVKHHFQRNGTNHIGRFDGTHVLAADADPLCYLFLCLRLLLLFR